MGYISFEIWHLSILTFIWHTIWNLIKAVVLIRNIPQIFDQMRAIFLIPFTLITYLTFGQDADAIRKILSGTQVDKLQQLGREWQYRDSLQKATAIQKAQEKSWPVRIESPEQTIELMGLDRLGNPLYYYTGNVAAAISTQVDQLHSGGGSGLNLEGNGMTLGEWDGGGVRLSHDQLSGRVTQVDNPSGNSWHATHVAGTLIGDGTPSASAKGMAPQASLDAHDWNYDNTEMTTAAANGLLISNHSYGYVTGWNGSNAWFGGQYAPESYGFGIYNSAAIDWDNIAYNAPYYLICKSAGNDRNDGTPSTGTQWELNGSTDTMYTFDPVNHPESSPEGDGGSDDYDCISWMGNAKNILTVGAVDDVTNYTGPGSVSMSSFSGWGPTDDGRIKPDIVGNGISLYSSHSDADNAYTNSSGTSMSGPNVAGSLLLLQEHYMNTHNNTPMLAATLKGLAIHTARECGSADGPDYEFGWGLLSAKDAADLITDDVSTDSTIAELSLDNGTDYTYTFESDGSQAIRATICWTDLPGPSSGYTLNDPSIKLVNDLDLRITEGSNTYEPYVLSPTTPGAPATTGDNILDNVEQVYIANPLAGQYTLTVSHKGSLSSAQNFSLIVSGQNNIILPVEFVEVKGDAKQDHNQITCALYEENLDELQLQRWDGSQFLTLSSQFSDGEAKFNTYLFRDTDLSKQSHYLYRIKAIDKDGSVDLSGIINISRQPTDIAFDFYPNPVSSQIFFEGMEGVKNLRLVNNEGRVIRVWSSNLPSEYNAQLLPDGTYYLIAEMSGHIVSRKLVKE